MTGEFTQSTGNDSQTKLDWPPISNINERPSVLSVRRQAYEDFGTFFSNLGYQRTEALPLLPQSDPTLIFTNSTIVAFKEQIASGTLSSPGAFIKQPCLRLQNLKAIAAGSPPPRRYASSFTMLGVTSPANQSQHLHAHVYDYLTSCLHIPLDRLQVLGSNGDQPLVSFWEGSSGVTVLIDSRPPEFYRWKYGVAGLSGRGLTFEVLLDDGTSRDIGNVIEIYSGDKLVAIEFAIGLEVALVSKQGYGHPLDFHSCSGSISIECYRHNYDFIDLLTSIHAMHQAGVGIDNSGAGHIFKRSIRELVSLEERLRGPKDISLFEHVIADIGHISSAPNFESDLLELTRNSRRINAENDAKYRKWLLKQEENNPLSFDDYLKSAKETFGLTYSHATRLISQLTNLKHGNA